MTTSPPPDDALDDLQRKTFGYFLNETNPKNGMVPDSTREGAAASLTAIGLGLTACCIGVERGWLTRRDAVERALTTLRFFRDSEQGTAPDATGFRGFYYHFLDMATGRRANGCELSTIDTAFLLAGFLTARAYFDRADADEAEIRTLAESLNDRVDWHWAQDGGVLVTHGWKPESGFLRYRWGGYSEALLLYAIGLGSRTFPLPAEAYDAWAASYRWKRIYGVEFLYAGPLFIHQLSHAWIDFRGIQDAFMRDKGIDYFENSRRAVRVQQAYAIRNPRRFEGYGEHAWGITASDGPGPARRRVRGKDRRFYDYKARGVPYGPDDGTLAPWAMVASLPFAPELVMRSIAALDSAYPEMTSEYGFKCSYNPTFDSGPRGSRRGWVSKGYYGIDQGPIVIMIENHRSDFPWRLMRNCSVLATGLRRAGFANGWLASDAGTRTS